MSPGSPIATIGYQSVSYSAFGLCSANVLSSWTLFQTPKPTVTSRMKPSSEEKRFRFSSAHGCQMKSARSFRYPRKK